MQNNENLAQYMKTLEEQVKAQRYLQKRYFCKDFFGMREDGSFTNTIVGEMKIPDYYKKI